MESFYARVKNRVQILYMYRASKAENKSEKEGIRVYGHTTLEQTKSLTKLN